MKKTILLGMLFLVMSAYAQEETRFNVSFSNPITAINPIYAVTTDEAQFFTGIHEGLVQYDPKTLFPRPAIAESWDITRNNTRFTFTLRDDARFSNGESITAQDFIDSWMAQIDAGKDAYFAAFFDSIQGVKEYRNTPATPVGLRALDEKTLQVDLNDSVPYFLKMLCHHSFTVTHDALRSQGKNTSDVLSIPFSGPYQIEEVLDSSMTLEKNDYYWDYDNVYFTEIHARFDSTDPEKITDLYNRDMIDWVTGYYFDYETLESPSSFVGNDVFSSTFLFFKGEGVWANPRIRRALALLVDWSVLRSREFFNIPTANLIQEIPDYTPAESLDSQNIREALKILAELGYSKSNLLPPLRIVLPSESWRAVLSPLEEWWEPLVEEFTISILENDVDSFEYYGDSSDYELGLVSWIADYTDPYALLEMFVEGSAINFARFSDEEFNEYIAESFSETDRALRYEALTNAESVLLQSAAVMPLSRHFVINLIDTERYDGWYPNILDIHPFAFLSLNPNAGPEDLVDARESEYEFATLR